jgi:hypothetical protein
LTHSFHQPERCAYTLGEEYLEEAGSAVQWQTQKKRSFSHRSTKSDFGN